MFKKALELKDDFGEKTRNRIKKLFPYPRRKEELTKLIQKMVK